MLSANAIHEDGTGNYEHWHVLMHEYAHLVQDRNTVSGIFEFLAFILRIEVVGNVLSQSPDGTVTIPLESVARSALPGYSLLRILQVPGQAKQPMFENPSARWQFKSYSPKRTTVEFDGVQFYRVDTAVTFKDETTGVEAEYMLGSRDIREAYSVAVQELHGGPTPSNEGKFEYHAVPKILTALVGPLDARQIVAICHWALQSSTPAARLFQICEILNAYAPSLRDVPAKDIYDFLRNDAVANGLPAVLNEIILRLDQLINRHHGLDGPFLEAIRQHKRHVQIAFERMLDTSRYFPLDTALCRDTRHPYAESFGRLTQEEPIPQIETLDGYDSRDYAYGGDADDTDQDLSKFLRAMRGLIDFLLTGDEQFRQCPLFAPCQLPEWNNGCRTAPWEKEHCHYGAAAHALGIPRLYTIRI
jgi:hypothetical protein